MTLDELQEIEDGLSGAEDCEAVTMTVEQVRGIVDRAKETYQDGWRAGYLGVESL